MTPTRIIILSILFSALVAFGAVKLAMPEGKGHRMQKETAFQRVMRTNTLRCGYYMSREFILRDEKTGKLSGPAYEIIEAMAKNLGLKVEWTMEINAAAMGDDLKAGRYDMVCVPLSATAPRSRVVFFSRPVFFMPVHLWVHKDSAYVTRNDLEWADDPKVTFSAIDGLVFATLAKRIFPKARIHSLPEMSQLAEPMMDVQMKKADATLMTATNGDYFAKGNGNAIVPVGLPVSIISMQFPLPHGDEAMRNMVDITLGELLNNGDIETILAPYDTSPPKYFMQVNPAYRGFEAPPQ